jgi:hypothetical protein
MKKYLVVILVSMTGLFCSTFACDNDRTVGGYSWTFHRMPDNNSYHECRLNSSFNEGSSLVMDAPCDLSYIDAVQVDWKDNGSKMRCTLIVNPGHDRKETLDVTGKTRGSWGINREVSKLEFEFSGPRDKSCTINWIRIFYGKGKKAGQSHSGDKPQSGSEVKTVDRIKFKTGPDVRECRMISWNGAKLILIVNRGDSGNIQREVEPGTVDYIEFSPRWGQAVLHNGDHFKLRVKRMSDNKLWIDKDIDGRIVAKDEYPIEKFKSIEFN